MAPVLDTALGLNAPAYGRSSADAGKISFAAVRMATQLAMRRLVAGIVTAPISKKAWSMAGVPFTDHTEYFRIETNSPAEMILGAPAQKLWCILATRHIELKQASSLLKVDRIVSAARSLRDSLRQIGFKRPNLGLCAFNPHAGEEGMMGSEERRILRPVALKSGLVGPIAADTAWRWHREGKLDALVCLYHDQALIPLKTAAGLEIVNWTTGLPFVRTSPGHGTGMDVAGKGRADESATVQAALLAARLCGRASS